MKKIIYIFAIIILSACTINSNVIKEPYSEIELYFCPEDFCLERILTLVDESVDIKCAFYDLDIPILIEKLQENKTENKKEITNMKRKLTVQKKEVAKMETAYESDDVESAEEFLRKFSKSK